VQYRGTLWISTSALTCTINVAISAYAIFFAPISVVDLKARINVTFRREENF
jgi:hypothetical protein